MRRKIFSAIVAIFLCALGVFVFSVFMSFEKSAPVPIVSNVSSNEEVVTVLSIQVVTVNRGLISKWCYTAQKSDGTLDIFECYGNQGVIEGNRIVIERATFNSVKIKAIVNETN